MDCVEIRKLFWDSIENKLAGNIAGSFQAHLSRCPQCQREYKFFSDMIGQIGKEKVVSANPFFVEKVMNKVFQPEAEPFWLEKMLLSWIGTVKPAFIAAGVAIAIAIGIYLGLPAGEESRYHPADAFANAYGLYANEDILID